MPQIEQIAATYASQIFWLLLTFGFVFVVVGLGMVPKVLGTVELRDKRIADDLAAAEAARAEADAKEEAFRLRTEANRAEALKVTQAAQAEAAAANAAKLAQADEELGRRTDEAEARIRASANAAMAEIETIAAEAARDLVAKLSGANVSEQQAQQAVKAVLGHGA